MKFLVERDAFHEHNNSPRHMRKPSRRRKCYDDHSSFIAMLKVETTLDNLRTDPRFKELLKRPNLPDEVSTTSR